MSGKKKLWVVVPVYNEEVSILYVIKEWIPVLRKVVGADNFVFCTLNDGSKDSTSKILHEQAKIFSEMHVIDKPNSGHGQTCLCGYLEAIKGEAEWVLQIDSDGQCDASFFERLWAESSNFKVVFGYRTKREDGRVRYLISRIVSEVVLLTTGVFVRDANVPYRLMHRSTLVDLIKTIPTDFKLVNILLSVLLQRRFGIRWVDIVFRDRFGGSSSVKAYSFFKEGLLVVTILKECSKKDPVFLHCRKR